MIVPIPRGNWQETVLPRAEEIKSELQAAGVRVIARRARAHTPGWKFAEWELRGVPLRLEIGPKDIEKRQVVLVRRDTREKQPTPMSGLTARVQALLETIQQDLLDRARTFRDEHTSSAETYDEFRRVDGRPSWIRQRTLVRR